MKVGGVVDQTNWTACLVRRTFFEKQNPESSPRPFGVSEAPAFFQLARSKNPPGSSRKSRITIVKLQLSSPRAHFEACCVAYVSQFSLYSPIVWRRLGELFSERHGNQVAGLMEQSAMAYSGGLSFFARLGP